MSKTIIDMPKVAQMLDNGWKVHIFSNGLRSYTAVGQHPNLRVIARLSQIKHGPFSIVDEDGDVVTDDFTPEQALTRLAYKVHGEIIDSK